MKYGLLSDDLTKENATTKEALRRLPKDVFQERQFRHAKAINVSGNKDVLPQSEWIKPEQVN
jgi:ubiquinol-cytochrome c reductase subunit 7